MPQAPDLHPSYNPKDGTDGDEHSRQQLQDKNLSS